MIKIKSKEIKFERLETDPSGYHNTRIGITAELEENDDPKQCINKLREIVLERHGAYQEINEISRHKRSLQWNLQRIKDSLHQIKLDESSKEKLDEINKELEENIKRRDELENRLDELLG